MFGRNFWLDNKVYDLLVRNSFHLTHGILGPNPATNVLDMTWHDPIIVNPAVIWINQSSQVQHPGLLMRGKIHINMLLWLRVPENVSFWQGGSSPNSWRHYGLIVERLSFIFGWHAIILQLQLCAESGQSEISPLGYEMFRHPKYLALVIRLLKVV